MSFSDYAVTIFVAMALMMTGAVLISLLPTPLKSTVRTQFILSFCASLVLLAAYWHYSAIWGDGQQGFSYSDDQAYHLKGQSMANAGDVFDTDDRNPGFTIWTAMLYNIFGVNTIVIRVFNIFFHCLWILPIAFIARTYGDPRVTRLAILLTAWAPSPLLASLLHVKDLIAGLALLTALASIISIERSRASAASLLGAAIALWWVRRDLLILIAAIALLHLFALLKRGRLSPGRIAVLAALVLFVASSFTGLVEEWMSGRIGANLVSVVFTLTSQSAANAQGLAPFFINSPGEVWKLPFSMAASLLMPFPPRLNGGDIFQIANGFASIFVLILLPFVFIGCLDSIERWARASFPAYAGFLGCSALLAVVYPGMPRYREQLLGLFCLLAALGIVRMRAHLWLFAGSSITLYCAAVIGTAVYL